MLASVRPLLPPPLHTHTRLPTHPLHTHPCSLRCADLVDVEDPRVDVCLYCLPPHRLRQNDVR
jgi:hypothetical protein